MSGIEDNLRQIHSIFENSPQSGQIRTGLRKELETSGIAKGEGIAKGYILLYEGASVDESSGMPRTSSASRGGSVEHVLNRGNGRCDVFHQDDAFAAFVNLLREAHEKVPMRLTGFV